MVRSIATLLLLATLASISNACPWWGRRCSPRPVVAYAPYVPPTVPDRPAPPDKPEASADQVFDPTVVYEKAVRSCVFIVTPFRGTLVESSGALINVEKKLVITTHKAVDGDVVYVQFPFLLKDQSLLTDKMKYLDRIPAGQAIKGKVIFRDKTRNLALVQLERLPPGTPALPLGTIEVGGTGEVRSVEHVFHIGSPPKGDKVFVMTRQTADFVGIEEVDVPSDRMVLRTRWQVVATTGPASADSGGPVIDKQGRLVAVWEGSVVGVTARNVHLSLSASEVQAFLEKKRVSDREALEEAAGELLRRSKLFNQGEDNRPTYKLKLKQVIEKYPGTPAAKEAQKILDGLK